MKKKDIIELSIYPCILYLSTYITTYNKYVLSVFQIFLLLILIRNIFENIKLLSGIGYISFNLFIICLGSVFLDLGITPNFIFARSYKSFNGSSLRLLIFIIVFIKVYAYFVVNQIKSKNYHKKNKKIRMHLDKIIVFVILFFQVVLIKKIVDTGINLVDRKRYIEQNFGTIEILAYVSIIQFNIFLGLFYSKEKKKIFLILNLISLIILKLTGSKFGEIFTGILLFVAPLILNSIYDRGIRFKISQKGLKYIFLGMTIFFLMIYSVATAYSKAMNGMITPKESLNMILQRIASQSILYNEIESERLNIFEIQDELIGLTKWKLNIVEYMKTTNRKVGLFKLNYVFDKNFFEDNLNKGYNLSGGFPGILVYYFGFLGTFISIFIVAYFLSRYFLLLYKYVLNYDLIGLYLTAELYTYLESFLILGNLYYMFRYSFLFRIIFILGYDYFIFKRRFKKCLSY